MSYFELHQNKELGSTRISSHHFLSSFSTDRSIVVFFFFFFFFFFLCVGGFICDVSLIVICSSFLLVWCLENDVLRDCGFLDAYMHLYSFRISFAV